MTVGKKVGQAAQGLAPLSGVDGVEIVSQGLVGAIPEPLEDELAGDLPLVLDQLI